MKPTFIRRYTINMCGTKRRKRVNIRISGKHHARIGLVRRVDCPYTYDGTMKACVFIKWFQDELLQCLPNSCAIIMDNASFHKKRSPTETCKKILSSFNFPAAVFAGI